MMANILIIKQGALGDIIIATSLIKQIQQHHVKDDVWLLTTPAFNPLFANWQDLNVQTFDRKGIFNNLQTILWIRQEKFQRVYDLQSNDRTAIFCALSGVPERIGNHPRYPYSMNAHEPYHGQCHIYDHMINVLKSSGIDARAMPPCLPSSEQEDTRVEKWLAEHEIKAKQFVIMHAGASEQHKQKRWPYYHDLAKSLVSRGLNIIWVGADADTEINAQLAAHVGIDATNALTITELAALGRQARFAVTNDSGPMHILSCADIPVYAFFGPSNWRRNHAIGQADRVFTPPSTGFNKLSEKQDLKNIMPGQVMLRLEKDGLLAI